MTLPNAQPAGEGHHRPPGSNHPLAAAYGATAADWAGGPARAYDRLAEALVAASPARLAGARVLDLGAGTGAASAALARAGAEVVAVDLALGMLRHDRARRPPAAAGDADALPLRDGTSDAVVAAFVLNHTPDPALTLAEAARVTRPGGVVLASVFSHRSGHPGKGRVDEVATRFGYRPPAWYAHLKREVEPLTARPAALAGAARRAGLSEIRVHEAEVDVGLESPEELAAWRLGTAALAPFVASLDPDRRQALRDSVMAALGPAPQPFVPVVLILSSRTPA